MSKIVKNAHKDKAFEDLIEQQSTYSKGSNLDYGKLMMRGYLKNQNITVSQAKLIFLLRSRMLKVKDNFRGAYINNMICPCCLKEFDDQLHFISCSNLSGTITVEDYNYIFGGNDDKMVNVIRKLEERYQERKNKTI